MEHITDIPLNTQENIKQPEVLDESLEEIGRKREIQIREKKKFFNKVRFVIFILFLTATGLFISYVIVWNQRTTAPAPPIVIEEPTPTPTAPDNIWELTRDDNLKLFVKVPPEAKYFTYDNPSRIEVVYAKNETDLSLVTESNLSDGYIFRITPLILGTRDLSKIAEIKRESYKIKCPKTATISIAQGTKVDGVDAKFFDVNNCNVDYKYTYVPRFGIYYEIAQIYRGDVGIGQQYKSKTEELISALRFFPEDSPKPYNPYASYYNETYNFSIKYPYDMDTNCCNLQGPATASIGNGEPTTSSLLTAAYMPTYKSSKEFDGFGLYLSTVSESDKTESFETYIDKQKQRLIEDYKVVTGDFPVNTSVEDIQVGTQTGKILKGYHWQGTDLIYLQIPSNKKRVILTLVIKNISGETFSKVSQEIINSFEYFPIVQ